MDRHAAFAFGLAGLCVVCATVLTMFNHSVPDFLQIIGGAAIGGGAGLSIPKAPVP